jgi:hypothetical protein
MKKLLFLAAFLFSITTFAQQNYEVIILPKKFDFLKEDNMYNLNAVTKSFFETEGFIVYYAEDTLPKEIANNRCTALFGDVIESNNLFTTKLEVVLKDCQNTVLLTSTIGTSKEKEYFKAYNEALRTALISMRGKLDFKNENTIPVIVEENIVVEEVLVEKNLNEVVDNKQKF